MGKSLDALLGGKTGKTSTAVGRVVLVIKEVLAGGAAVLAITVPAFNPDAQEWAVNTGEAAAVVISPQVISLSTSAVGIVRLSTASNFTISSTFEQ